MSKCIGSVVLALGVSWASVAMAEERASYVPSDMYVTYETIQRGEIELTFDSAELSRQGWSISESEHTFPVAVGMDNAIEIMTLNGELLTMSGSPQVLGTIEMDGPEGHSLEIAGFTIPFRGFQNAQFLDGQHPMFEIEGDSLTIDLDAPLLTISGYIGLAGTAGEYGLDASVGAIGAFTLHASVHVTGIDATVDPPAVEATSGEENPLPVLPGADVIVGSLPTMQTYTGGGPVNGMRAYSVATTSCNIGTQPLDWFEGPNSRHPVIAQNIYRLRDGRFEQLGQSWLKHGFCALQQSLCESCIPVGNCCCSQLGVGCSDPYSAPRNGSWGNLGPKTEIDVHQGTNLGNHAFATGEVVIRGRIQIHDEDLGLEGASYVVEGHYVAQDDAQFGDLTNDNNNASWRDLLLSGSNYVASFPSGSSTHRQEIAMHAWVAADPEVAMVNLDVPGEGRFTLGYRVTENGDGTWHYEYAIHNLNSDRAGQAFSVPIGSGLVVSNIGFHDVDYHSGDPYSLQDWSVTEGASVTWSCETVEQNTNANALRWGTLYNFRFDATLGPEMGNVELTLFKNGAPSSVLAEVLVPIAITAGDSNGDGDVDGFDFEIYLACVTGPAGEKVPPGCEIFDLDFDDDIDFHDAGLLQLSFTGDCGVTVTQQPELVTVCLGESAMFQVETEGVNLSYQWHHNGEAIAGANASVLEIAVVTEDDLGVYFVEVIGGCATRNSNAADLATFDPPAFQTQPESLTACLGDPVEFSVAVEGFAPLTYQWQLNGVDIPGANDPIYAIGSIEPEDFGAYRCVATDGCQQSAASGDAVLDEWPTAVITAHPVGGVFCVDATIFMFASATGAESFQWFKNGEPIPGATSPFLAIPSATMEDAGAYHVDALGACNTDSSDVAVVEVINCDP